VAEEKYRARTMAATSHKEATTIIVPYLHAEGFLADSNGVLEPSSPPITLSSCFNV